MDVVDAKLVAVVRRVARDPVSAADAADTARAHGELHGVPFTLKTNTHQRGHPADNGAVATPRHGGAAFIGRTHAPAFSRRIFSGNAPHGPHSHSVRTARLALRVMMRGDADVVTSLCHWIALSPRPDAQAALEACARRDRVPPWLALLLHHPLVIMRTLCDLPPRQALDAGKVIQAA